MPTERDRRTESNPFPEGAEFYTEIDEVDDRLRDLREKARTGADVLSAASSIAALQVDLIASGLALNRVLADLAFQLLAGECPFEERIRRLQCLLRLTSEVQFIILRSMDAFLSSFGGKEAIAIQATAEWITRLRERSPADAAQVDQILKMMFEKSAK